MSSQLSLFPDQELAIVPIANDGGINTRPQLEALTLSVAGALKK